MRLRASRRCADLKGGVRNRCADCPLVDALARRRAGGAAPAYLQVPPEAGAVSHLMRCPQYGLGGAGLQTPRSAVPRRPTEALGEGQEWARTKSRTTAAHSLAIPTNQIRMTWGKRAGR